MAWSEHILVRLTVLTGAACLYAAGCQFAAHNGEVWDNSHNWRAYYDSVAGNTLYMSAFESDCRKTYAAFRAPAGERNPEYGKCEAPPAHGIRRNPVSALTSLIFLAVSAVAVQHSAEGLAVALALLGGGSFRLHASGDTTGSILDHTMVGVAAVLLLQNLIARQAPKMSKLLMALALAGILSMVSQGRIIRNAEAATAVAAVAAAVVSITMPKLLLNVVLPLGVGFYLTDSVSGKFLKEAECTGDTGVSDTYDKTHAAWHICVAIGVTEGILLHDSFNPASLLTAILAVVGAADPSRMDIGMGVTIACAAVATAAAEVMKKDTQETIVYSSLDESKA